MWRVIVKLTLAFVVGALFGACGALWAMEYNWNITLTLVLVMLATAGVDYALVRAQL